MEAPRRLVTERITVEVDPAAGGRLTQLWVDGSPVLVGYDDVPAALCTSDGSPAAMAWGAYPMVPWAGRIRHGRFTFRGREHSLPPNDGDHAIHGVGFASSWSVSLARPDRLRLEVDLPADDRWPFGGHVVQTVSVTNDGVLLRMQVTAGEQAFPLSIGWHPWFRKPDRFDFHPARMYRRDAEGIAVDHLVEVSPGPWDDCFTNVLPVGLSIDGVNLELTSGCTHWVVFDELPHATCVEPQSAPPDAFTIASQVLAPGESEHAWFRIATAER